MSPLSLQWTTCIALQAYHSAMAFQKAGLAHMHVKPNDVLTDAWL